jgi:hypothetical protein
MSWPSLMPAAIADQILLDELVEPEPQPDQKIDVLAEAAKVRAERNHRAPEANGRGGDAGVSMRGVLRKRFLVSDAVDDVRVDQLCAVAAEIAVGLEVDFTVLSRQLGWPTGTLSKVMADAKNLDRWPYRPARPAPKPVARRNADGMPIWPDPPTHPVPWAVSPPPDGPHQDSQNHQPRKPMASQQLPDDDLDAVLTPALAKTVWAARRIQVNGIVHYAELARELDSDVKAIYVRVDKIRQKDPRLWPFRPPDRRRPVPIEVDQVEAVESEPEIVEPDPTPEPTLSHAAGESQVGGDHYVRLAIQPWDAMAAWMTPEQFEGFLAGNALKYLARYRSKGGVEDVRKAAHYAAKLIEHLDACGGTPCSS